MDGDGSERESNYWSWIDDFIDINHIKYSARDRSGLQLQRGEWSRFDLSSHFRGFLDLLAPMTVTGPISPWEANREIPSLVLLEGLI